MHFHKIHYIICFPPPERGNEKREQREGTGRAEYLNLLSVMSDWLDARESDRLIRWQESE